MSIHPTILKDGLIKLGMYTDKPSDGLKFVNEIDIESDNHIKIHLIDAKKYGATAAYFRHFENRPSIPQIYIYEDLKDINTLHKELWSSCKVPMFFVFSKTEIKIFNSMSKRDIFERDIKPFETIIIASKIQKELKYFKATMFDSGEFWNKEYSKLFSHKNSAYNSLLDKLEFERKRLREKSKLSSQLTNSLLIKSILLKYLEEKKVFELNYWNSFEKDAKSFIDVVKSRQENNKSLVKLFDDLSNHFNGGIFKLDSLEIEELKNADLTEFKYFLQPNIDKNKNLYFWDLFSFKDLPIELISNIYELFLTENEKKGVVYTPSILVDFMIDEMIPLDDSNISFKVIDPSCGSGIFLVGTFKRLVQRWMIANDFKIPTVKILQSLILNNIFGIDEKEEAVEVAKFSLSLALCEILAPEIIWNELHFDDLSKTGNLIAKDFFEVLNDKVNYPNIKDFDLVIGNPPFMSNKIISNNIKEIENKNLKDRPKLPDDQLAYLFLEQSFKLLKKDALISMVQPSGFLYNNKVELFRKYLLNNFNLRQVIDFTGLNKLYDGSKKDNKTPVSVATSVLCFENNKPKIETSEILHLTVRQTFESKEKLYFDLSYYDFHWISYQEAIENKYIWKCNLVGGNRVVDIINRFNQYPKLNDYLNNKIEEDNWIYSEGYILGNRKKKTPWLYNHLALLPKAKSLNENGIDWNKTYCIEEKSFEAPRKKELFEAPLVVIREVFNKETILLDYSDKDIAFTNRYVGISASNKDKNNLKEIVNNLKTYSKEYIFNIIATSSQVGVGMATPLLKKDIDLFPYPIENIKSLKLSKTEQYFADDTIDYMLDWINGNQKLPIFENASNKQLKEYQDIYCDLLNAVYDKYIPFEILPTEQFTIMSFYYKDKPDSSMFNDTLNDTDIENLINKTIGRNVNITRIFKYYVDNLIYIIKPKQYRYWLKSIAVKDADDTFSDLVDMRY